MTHMFESASCRLTRPLILAYVHDPFGLGNAIPSALSHRRNTPRLGGISHILYRTRSRSGQPATWCSCLLVLTMPKKHTPAYTTTKPNYVHSALRSWRATASSAPAGPWIVSDRIAQLRRERAPRATAEQRNEISSLVSSRTPPDLRQILHIPEVNAPKPKAGTRMRT
jgi:hypothetical protein